MDFMSTIITQDEYSVSKTSSGTKPTASCRNSESLDIPAQVKSNESSTKKSKAKKITSLDGDIKADHVGETLLKPSLKSTGAKKEPHYVTWADNDRSDSVESRELCEVRELKKTKSCADKFAFPYMGDDNDSVRFASTEACAMALRQAAEAVATGDNDAADAVSEAGIIVLPPPNDMDKEYQGDVDMLESEPTPKWPMKAGVPNYDLFESEDSWFDTPPEGFSLTLSPFATMWNALFEWISSSSLAFIYGQDDSFNEDYISCNGKEYPPKIVLSGKSSEIKLTLGECLGRALPGLATDLKLPTPISTMEQGMVRLLETVSFVDPLPPFRMKQWQVIVLLFIDALSVSRIPAPTPHMTRRRIFFHKVLDGAQIGAEEYEILKDLVIPLGRVP